MIYVLIIGCLLTVLGLLHLLFAFIPAPTALDPFLNSFGRRINFVVSFFPEAQHQRMGRLLSGASLLLGGMFAVVLAVFRLFLS